MDFCLNFSDNSDLIETKIHREKFEIFSDFPENLATSDGSHAVLP